MDKKIEEAMKSAKASLQIDGFTITDEHTELVRKVLQKEITEEEFHRIVWELIQKNNSKPNKND